MTDLHTLNEAFTELERRADAVSTAGRPAPTSPTRRRTPRRGATLVPVAATVAAVAGMVAVVALLVPGGESGTQVGAAPPDRTATTTLPVPRTSELADDAVPDDPDELAERFRAVLGETATFVVTETGAGVRGTVPPSSATAPGTKPTSTPKTEYVGAAILGTLTSSGNSGGFDLGIYPADRGGDKSCAQRPDLSRCTDRTLPDGSTLIIGRYDELEGPAGGITYSVELLRADGVEFIMHLSNLHDPKGAGPKLAPKPPLTLAQMVEIVTSDRW